MKFITLLLFVIFAIGCKQTEAPTPAPVEQTQPTPAPIVTEPVVYGIAGSWENTTESHPERQPWTAKLEKLFTQDLGLYGSATDVVDFCPKFHDLNDSQKLKALIEFSIALALYESSFKPGQYSVDVGTKNDKGSWSVGLYQMSGNDNSAKEIGATFETLKDPLVNIEVYMIQLKKQIAKRNKFFLNNSDSMRYWAVALRQNKYSKIPEIKARVLKYSPACK